MNFLRLTLCLTGILGLLGGLPALPQDTGLAQIKERELEAVREKISDLKESMDRRARRRDEITGELQSAEIEIVEKRNYLKDIERQLAFSEKRKAEIEERLAARETELAAESEQLQAQVKAAYTSGKQERIKLLLNQHDPATLGRLLTYYRYMSEFRGRNIETVNGVIAELAGLRASPVWIRQ